ncbi:MAG: biotin--[acetyl-CoA-carboxylase] ligase [Caldilineaceae bacterium]|nr:biotin--[acetyl-CoA-carboxylase] ligase [Caldilineaceae bacterium]
MSVSANTLDLGAVAAALQNAPIGHTIDYRPQLSSTMDLARQHAVDPAILSGTVVVADEQTAGRGRGVRRWEVPPGEGLLLSLLLKAPIAMSLPEIPMLAGLAAIDALVAYRPTLHGQVGLKWPNDLLLGSGMHDARKVGGILVESSFYGAALEYVIIGMGVNLLQQPTALPLAQPGAPAPTSLAHFLAVTAHNANASLSLPPLNRTALLIALCQAWGDLLDPLPAPAQILARWRAALWTLGQEVAIQPKQNEDVTQAVTVVGRAIDVSAAGELIIQDAAGKLHSFGAGDVSVRMAE